MRQFLVSAGRTMFKNKGIYRAPYGRPGHDQQRGVTQTSTKDHPIEEPHMSSWEHTKEKISNKGKAGFGSDTKPIEMPIVERARVKGADRQANQSQRRDAIGNANLKTSLQDDMNAGIGINQSDATTSKKWTETAKDQTRDLGNLGNKKRSPEQLLRDVASGKMDQQAGMSKEMQDLAEKQRRADERAAKYPNMPKQEFSQTNTAKEKEHKETDKITSVINEEHGIPEVGERKQAYTGIHEQHGAKRAGGMDDMIQNQHSKSSGAHQEFSHEPKMRFDAARSSAENANRLNEQQVSKSGIRSTADHQKLSQEEHGVVDSLKDKANTAASWMKEKLGSDPAQQRADIKRAKAEGRQEVNEAESKVQPQMRGDFGVLSGSPVGGIKNPEKRSRRLNQEGQSHNN